MKTINCRGRLLDLSNPQVMGILNLTPDSFYDGGRFNTSGALEHCGKMINDGASIIDIGAMSSRPGAEVVTPEEEWTRMQDVLTQLVEHFPGTIFSIDTIHASVAEHALKVGAHIINDITGGMHDEHIVDVCVAYDAPYILMHTPAMPDKMQDHTEYEDVVLDILKFFNERLHNYRNKGLKDIIIDPGFGFGKTVEQNYALLRKLSVFKITEAPVLAGISRKSMICKVLKVNPPAALNGTTALHMIALQNGANILRVHDVKEAMECITLTESLKSS